MIKLLLGGSPCTHWSIAQSKNREFTNVAYHAYEIDKYAIRIAQSNYSDIIQCGDAYGVRDDFICP